MARAKDTTTADTADTADATSTAGKPDDAAVAAGAEVTTTESADDTPKESLFVRKPALRKVAWIAAATGVVALIAFVIYLWDVNNQWSAQNAELRAEAQELGETLSKERTEAIEQAAVLETTAEQLATATGRISDLANEEANAIDDRRVLADLVEALINCADLRQSHIEVLRNSSLYYPGKTTRQVENEYTAYCNELEQSYNDFKADRG